MCACALARFVVAAGVHDRPGPRLQSCPRREQTRALLSPCFISQPERSGECQNSTSVSILRWKNDAITPRLLPAPKEIYVQSRSAQISRRLRRAWWLELAGLCTRKNTELGDGGAVAAASARLRCAVCVCVLYAADRGLSGGVLCSLQTGGRQQEVWQRNATRSQRRPTIVKHSDNSSAVPRARATDARRCRHTDKRSRHRQCTYLSQQPCFASTFVATRLLWSCSTPLAHTRITTSIIVDPPR